MSHLTHFGIGNFKVFNELTDFELSPLTILTGKNNSGKSSLIKAFMLSKMNLKSNRPMWGNPLKTSFDELDFSFPELKLGLPNETYNSNSKRKDMNFKFSISSLMFPKGILNLMYYPEENNDEILRLNAFDINSDNVPVVSFITEKGRGNLLKIDFQYFIDRIHEVHQKSIGWKDFGEKIGLFKRDESVLSSTNVEPFLKLLSSDKLVLGFKNLNAPDDLIKDEAKYLNGAKIDIEENELLKVQSQLIELYQKGIRIEDNTLDLDIITQFFSTFSITLKKQIVGIFNEDDILKLKYYKEIIMIEPVLHPFFDYIKTIIGFTFSDFVESLENVSYLPAIRAKNERHYIISKEGFSIQEFDQKTFERIIKNEKIKKFLLDMLRDFEIGDDIKVTTYQRTATEIKINRNDKEILLSDLGFGYAQLLPIIFTILTTAEKWSYWKYKDEEGYSAIPSPIILIEEPESNLHPDFQSKLADLFVKAYDLFGIQFIIETHSEYLIRKLQYLTAKKNIDPKDISIYYFKENKINKIEISSIGNLSQEFGTGFFDEADNLAIKLLILSKHQKN